MSDTSTICTEKNSQRSSCPVANALDVIGDRWSILVIRDCLFYGDREFGQLLNSGEGISTNILSERLERLQKSRLIAKLPHPSHGKKFIYQLTEHGRSFAPVLVEFILWAARVYGNPDMPEVFKQRLANDKEGLIAQFARGEPLDIP